MSQPKDIIEYEVPNKGLVVVSLDETKWPRNNGEIGYVPHWAVVPDPEQPRDEEDLNPDSLKELGENIKTNGQSEVMKVRLLTSEERKIFRREDERFPTYILVSGERRWRGIAPELANVPVVEIRVAVYASKAAQFLDAYVINEDRENLPVRSVARSLKRLLEENCNGNVSELCRITGKGRPYVDTYLRINNLIPEAMAFLNSKLPESERMGVALASFLGKLSHEEQRRYIKPLMVTKEGGRSMTQRIRWLTDQLVHAGGGSASHRTAREVHPAEVRVRLERIIDSARANAQALLAYSDQMFVDAFRHLDAQECQNLVRQFETMEGLQKKVKDRFLSVTVEKRNFLERNKDALPGWRTVDYYESGRLLLRDALVSPEKYEQLKNLKWLLWQREGKPDPDAVPVTSTHVEAVNGHTEPLPASDDTETVAVTYFYRNGSRMEQLAEGQMVDKAKYQELRRDRKLFWQRNKLPSSTAEDEFCARHGLTFEGVS